MGGVLAMIAHLYQVEKVGRKNGLRGEDLRLLRKREARPMLNQLHEYLLTIREQVLPKSEAGQAITYALKNWTALTRYCSDGDLLIDNNGTERSLRSFAVGRNNWTSSAATTQQDRRCSWCCSGVSGGVLSKRSEAKPRERQETAEAGEGDQRRVDR
jgi:transposase